MKCFGKRATDGAAITIFFKVFSSKKIFKFLQGLVGFGNLRFAGIKSYELRKVEISCQKWLGEITKVLGFGKKKHKKTNILLFLADIHTYKLIFVNFFMFFLHLPLIWHIRRRLTSFRMNIVESSLFTLSIFSVFIYELSPVYCCLVIFNLNNVK